MRPEAVSNPALSGAEQSDAAASETNDNDAGRDSGAESINELGARYTHRGELGRGGMGRVALVFDRWLGREVALKEPVSEAEARRLRREALITARLEHPGIVPVYDIGSSHGQPWFAMRVVRGLPLVTRLDGSPTLAERLGLVRHVLAACEAVAYAHARGVVHRDIKAANIMIGAFGETQVIDWGLALAPAEDLPAPSGPFAGTPESMSPEQARGEPAGAPSDVYSLGCVLWHVVAGHGPMQGRSREAILDALRRDDLPAAPLEAGPELAAIIRRAMAPLPSERYPTAQELATDLTRFLDGRRVEAHAYGVWEIVRRFLWAWRVPLAFGALALVAVAIVLVVSLARVERERGESEHHLAIALVAEAQGALRVDAVGEAEVLAANALARAPLPEARAVLAALPSPRPSRVTLATYPCKAIGIRETTVVCSTPEAISLYEGPSLRWTTAMPNARFASLVDRGRQVVLVQKGQIYRFDADNGRALGDPSPLSCNMRVEQAADDLSVMAWGTLCAVRIGSAGVEQLPKACPNLRGIAAAAIDGAGERWAQLCADGQLVTGRFDGPATQAFATGLTGWQLEASAVSFVPGSQDFLVGTVDGSFVRVRPSGELAHLGKVARLLRRIHVTPDGARAIVHWDGVAPVLYDLRAGARLVRVVERGPLAWWPSPEGEVYTAGYTLERWGFEDLRARALELGDGVGAMAVAADGKTLAIASGAWLTLIDVATRAPLARLHWQDDLVRDVSFAPDGSFVAAFGLGLKELRYIEVRGATPGRVARALTAAPNWRNFVVLPDGSTLASPYGSAPVWLRPERAPETLAEPVLVDLVASPDGRRLAALTRDGDVVRASDVHLGGRFVACDTLRDPRGIAVAPDDALFVALYGSVVAACPSGDERYEAPSVFLVAVAASRDYVAAGAADGAVWLWRRGTVEPVAVFRDHDMRVGALVFDPGGSWLAAGDWSGHVAFFGTPDLTPIHAEAAEALWALPLAEAFGNRGARVLPTR